MKYNNPGEEPQPYAYLPLEQYYASAIAVVARTDVDPGATLLTAQRDLQQLDPDLVINATTGSTITDNALQGQASTALLLGVFGVVALVLGAIGIYGVMSYGVRSRRREIGIRMALGAENSSILSMVLRQGLVLALIGLGVGVAVALGVTRLMRQILFVSPSDPIAFGLTALGLLVVAMLAALIPAWRAAGLSPIRVLRQE